MKPKHQVPVTLTKGTETLHFDNVKLAAEHFEVFGSSVSRALNTGRFRGYTIRRNI